MKTTILTVLRDLSGLIIKHFGKFVIIPGFPVFAQLLLITGCDGKQCH